MKRGWVCSSGRNEPECRVDFRLKQLVSPLRRRKRTRSSDGLWDGGADACWVPSARPSLRPRMLTPIIHEGSGTRHPPGIRKTQGQPLGAGQVVIVGRVFDRLGVCRSRLPWPLVCDDDRDNQSRLVKGRATRLPLASLKLACICRLNKRIRDPAADFQCPCSVDSPGLGPRRRTDG